MQEYARKEVEHAKAAADLQESYAAACRKMGIEVCWFAALSRYSLLLHELRNDLIRFKKFFTVIHNYRTP